ncbi:MAG TPA: hypothetical protein VF746_24625 [Longimicrobium sp.]|jgi:hypothetical protein
MSETTGTAAPPAPAHHGRYENGGPATEAELRFERKRMVQWLDPQQLCGTAVRAVLGAVFGAYADQREMQAALHEPREHDYSDADELWLDYTADLGDGFRSGYTIAWLLAQGKLALESPDGSVGPETPRGRLLMMGGDQVYPTASKQEYGDRTEGPYEAALPCHPEGTHPHLYAIPGNHDWYDGLTAFTRLFTQGRWIGGWQTQQARSYWALKLPHGWWVLGTDIQLQADIDQPQLDYFQKEVAPRFQKGDRVILLTAEPAWVHTPEEPDCFDALAFFERTVIREHGAELALTLTGDLHHYARYSDQADGRHKITAGGGGAYLYGTHRLPEEVELKERHGKSEVKAAWRRRAVFPSLKESLRLRAMAPLAPLANPGFAVFLSCFYAFYAWLLQSATLKSGKGLMSQITSLDWGDFAAVWSVFFRTLQDSPLLAILTVLVVYAWWKFCTPDAGLPKALKGLGILHGALHIVLAVTLMWAFTWFNAVQLGLPVDHHLGQAALFFGEMLVVGGVLGSLLVGCFLLPGVNFNEAFSAQHRTGWKNFLRLHIDRDGTLTVYPVGVRRAADWEFVPRAPAGQPFFRPKDGQAPAARLIEPPIRIAAPHPRIALTPEVSVVSEADLAAGAGADAHD